MDVHSTVSLIKLSKSLSGYIGLLETSDIKLSQLIDSELSSGISALQQADNSDSDKEKESLLREARGRFNKAISLEKELRLAIAYIGLAICHDYLGDRKNCISSLNSIDKIDLSYIENKILVSGEKSREIKLVIIWLCIIMPFLILFLVLFLVLFSINIYDMSLRKVQLKKEKLNTIQAYSHDYLDKIDRNSEINPLPTDLFAI